MQQEFIQAQAAMTQQSLVVQQQKKKKKKKKGGGGGGGASAAELGSPPEIPREIYAVPRILRGGRIISCPCFWNAKPAIAVQSPGWRCHPIRHHGDGRHPSGIFLGRKLSNVNNARECVGECSGERAMERSRSLLVELKKTCNKTFRLAGF